MTDVVLALEIWLLTSVLVAWMLCRAALVLRTPPLSTVELLAMQARRETAGAGDHG